MLREHLDLRSAVLVGGSTGGDTIRAHVAAHGTGRPAGVVVADRTPAMVDLADRPHEFYGCTEAGPGQRRSDSRDERRPGRPSSTPPSARIRRAVTSL